MSKITLITGGASSGKSRWAISYFASCSEVLYMCAYPHIDKDTANRIEWSKKHNGSKWQIVPNCRIKNADIGGYSYIIYDSLARYTSDMITSLSHRLDSETERNKVKTAVIDDVIQLIDKVKSTGSNIVIVTNEIGSSVIPPSDSQRLYRDILGLVNQRIANVADEVYLSVSGIQIKIK